VEAEIAAMAPGIVQLSTFSWNKRLSRYVKAGQPEKTMELFKQIERECISFDKFTFVPVLNACARLRSVEEGKWVHEHIIRSGFESDLFVAGALVDMYAKCGNMNDASRVFNQMPSRDVVSWNVMILGHVKCGQSQKALELFRQMQCEGVPPSYVTFMWVLNACGNVVALDEGRWAHTQILDVGCEDNMFVASSLVNVYAKCRSMDNEWRVFNKMASHDVVSWNALLQGVAMHGHGMEAVAHFERMCKEGAKANIVTFVCLLSACSHAGLLDEGLCYFDSMGSVYRIAATGQHYACMVDLLGRAGCLHEAEELIKTMSCEPSASVWKALLGACRVHGDVEMGECIAK
jgi:pentatricopeptide repeat protein